LQSATTVRLAAIGAGASMCIDDRDTWRGGLTYRPMTIAMGVAQAMMLVAAV
jgi:hypothetical protein